MRFKPGKQILVKPSAAPSPSEPALPTTGRVVMNAAKAAGRFGIALVTGQQVWQTPAKREENKAICQSNRCGLYRESDARCSHPNCGCYTKLKALLATEDCPMGYFSREEP